MARTAIAHVRKAHVLTIVFSRHTVGDMIPRSRCLSNSSFFQRAAWISLLAYIGFSGGVAPFHVHAHGGMRGWVNNLPQQKTATIAETDEDLDCLLCQDAGLDAKVLPAAGIALAGSLLLACAVLPFSGRPDKFEPSFVKESRAPPFFPSL